MNETLASFVPMLGRALLHFLWQGAVIGIAAALVLLALRRRAAQTRYLVACAGLLLMAIVPIVVTARNLADDPARQTPVIVTPTDAVAVATETVAVTSARPAPFSREWLEMRAPYVLAAWSAGVLLLGAQLVIGWLCIERIRRRATPLTEDRWTTAVNRLAMRLGVARSLRLVQSALVEVPAVVGWIRPMIVVPVSALAGLSPQYVEALLAHELAHVRRADYLVNVIQSVIETLLFYHPAVWWLSRQIRLERELCCDDLAAATCDAPLTYAHALASLEELRSGTPSLAMAADGGELLTRIRRLLEPGSAAGLRLTNLRGFAMGMVVIVLLLAINGETAGRSVATQHPALPPSHVIAAALPAPYHVPANRPHATAASAGQVRDQVGAATAQARTGVGGRVSDAHGGTIPGVTVTLVSAATGTSSQTVTNAAGSFLFSDLPPGEYGLTAALAGFRTTRIENLRVTQSAVTNIAIRLELGMLQESITISAPDGAGITTRPPAKAGSEYFDLAKAYYEQGRYAEAEQAMTRAIEMVRAAAPPQPPVIAQTVTAASNPNAPQAPIRIGGDIREPRKIKDVRPVYPPDALAAQVSGVVILEATVAKDGSVRDVRVLRSIPMLDAAAIDAVSQWKFTATELNGVPVEVLMTVTINFTGR